MTLPSNSMSSYHTSGSLTVRFSRAATVAMNACQLERFKDEWSNEKRRVSSVGWKRGLGSFCGYENQ